MAVNKTLDVIEDELRVKKIASLKQLQEYRKQQSREDPLVSRVQDDGKEHVAGCQNFLGEDREHQNRVMRQHEQRRIWAMEQVWEKVLRQKEQREEERYSFFMIQPLENMLNFKKIFYNHYKIWLTNKNG
jgi:hypothetical protein